MLERVTFYLSSLESLGRRWSMVSEAWEPQSWSGTDLAAATGDAMEWSRQERAGLGLCLPVKLKRRARAGDLIARRPEARSGLACRKSESDRRCGTVLFHSMNLPATRVPGRGGACRLGKRLVVEDLSSLLERHD